MINKIILMTVTIILSLIMSSCGTNKAKVSIDDKIEKMFSQERSPIVFEPEPTPAFIVVKSPKDTRLNKIVNVAINEPINIIAAIDFADRDLSISPDSGVNLDKKFNVKFNNQKLSRYFDYLQNITGYSIELDGGVVYIKSMQSKTWNLQTLSINNASNLSSSKAEIKSDSDVPFVDSKNSNDVWMEIVEQVKAIADNKKARTESSPVLADKTSTPQENSPTALVMHNQQQGTISVIALPSRVRAIDTWLNGLIKSSNRQVHLQVQVLDVTIDESLGQGINWNLISKQSSGQFQIGNNSKQAIEGAGIISIGSPAGTALDLGKKISLNLMLDLLRKQGKVRVDNQPNITVTNGREAYITTGDEFSYVASIKSATDAQGQVTTTSNVQRMNVGVDIKVTPKILSDNRIVVSVVPIVSSIKSFTALTSGSGSSMQEFKTPNIALQKLTTQVIVENGKTIHLGGLIASKVANAVKGLPDGGIMDIFFRGVQKSLERREIVILITPTIVR